MFPKVIEGSVVDERFVVSDIKQGGLSTVASTGSFDIEVIKDMRPFEKIYNDRLSTSVSFPDDFFPLPFHVPHPQFNNMFEASANVDICERVLRVQAKTQVPGKLISVLVHPRLRSMIANGELVVLAKLLSNDKIPKFLSDLTLVRAVDHLKFYDTARPYHDVVIGTSEELHLEISCQPPSKAFASSLDFLALIQHVTK